MRLIHVFMEGAGGIENPTVQCLTVIKTQMVERARDEGSFCTHEQDKS